jgi:transcriptional regulator NrdR family protein
VKCPKCAAETRVIDSRTSEDGAEVKRKRVCSNAECGHRLVTFETTYDVGARRAKLRENKARNRAKMSEEKLEATRKRRALLAQAYKEAHEKGVSVSSVREQWGLGQPKQNTKGLSRGLTRPAAPLV